MKAGELKYEGSAEYGLVHASLVWAARRRATFKYGDVGQLMGLSGGPEAMREVIQIISEIAQAEHQAGRPLLSAVVVTTKTGRPGKGFFEQAVELGKLPAQTGTEERGRFWEKELARVYSVWG
jgi:hypothetical protein